MNELMTVDIPEELQVVKCLSTGEAERVVKARLQIDESVILILALDWGHDLLRRNQVVAGDGTFSIVPPPFDQAFLLATDRYDILWPCMICMMPARNKSAYMAIFSWCRDNDITINSWLSDFERATIEVKYICNVILKRTIAGCEGCFPRLWNSAVLLPLHTKHGTTYQRERAKRALRK